jgi:type IV secretion system protein VirB1
MLDCPDLAVPREVMQHVVRVESSRNPFAIGVVGGYLARQPKNLDEALATVRQLKEEGFNFSVGISQVNRYNLAKYGLGTYEQAFEVCPNLQAGSRILRECYDRAQDWGKAFSCYYSGNFATGFQHGYVQKVFASMRKANAESVSSGAIRIISNGSAVRKTFPPDAVPLTRDESASTAPVGPAARVEVDSHRNLGPVTAPRTGQGPDSGLNTAESRAAIPVPGPGAIAHSGDFGRNKVDLKRIPTQLVGVNGDPYQTRLLPSYQTTVPSALSGEVLRPSDSNQSLGSSRGDARAMPPRRGAVRVGSGGKGGAIVQTEGALAPGIQSNSPAVPEDKGAIGRATGAAGDRSFVF